eukprot:COSAG05_NODE_6592_length_933_cov_1.539568_1_plen_101_part_10
MLALAQTSSVARASNECSAPLNSPPGYAVEHVNATTVASLGAIECADGFVALAKRCGGSAVDMCVTHKACSQQACATWGLPWVQVDPVASCPANQGAFAFH